MSCKHLICIACFYINAANTQYGCMRMHHAAAARTEYARWPLIGIKAMIM
jgi:hypothetical protein